MKLFFFMKGNILVSSPSLLNDTVFYKSIILIIDSSDNSHTGFILNKPGGLFFIKNESGKLNRNFKFNFGGPVSEETFFIIKNHNLYSQNFKINENLFWGNDVEMIINEIENKKIDPNEVIFLQGYAGWEEDQLKEELESNSWIVINNFQGDIFDLTHKNSWNKLIKSLGDKYLIWADSPDDISQN